MSDGIDDSGRPNLSTREGGEIAWKPRFDRATEAGAENDFRDAGSPPPKAAREGLGLPRVPTTPMPMKVQQDCLFRPRRYARRRVLLILAT